MLELPRLWRRCTEVLHPIDLVLGEGSPTARAAFRWRMRQDTWLARQVEDTRRVVARMRRLADCGGANLRIRA